MENETIQILELFGGIGSPRCALRNLNIPTKAIDAGNSIAVPIFESIFRKIILHEVA
jgi:DNA (cytosine-5)-methyltransferase 1